MIITTMEKTAYQCEKCGYKTTDGWYMKQHEKRCKSIKKSKQKPKILKVCQTCGKIHTTNRAKYCSGKCANNRARLEIVVDDPNAVILNFWEKGDVRHIPIKDTGELWAYCHADAMNYKADGRLILEEIQGTPPFVKPIKGGFVNEVLNPDKTVNHSWGYANGELFRATDTQFLDK